MEPVTCPRCASRFRNIRGVIFAAGSTDSSICENGWHLGPDYDPDTLNLTDEDRVLLYRMGVRGD
jgi:hypothetical protein